MEPQAPVLNQAQHGPALPGEGTRSKVSPGCNLIVKPALELQNTSARCFSSNTLGVHRETLTSCCRWRKDSPPGITGWAAALPALRPRDEGLSVSFEEMLRRHWLYHVPEHPFSAWECRSCSERGRLYHQVVPSSCFPLLTGHEFESLLSFFFNFFLWKVPQCIYFLHDYQLS